MKTFLILGAGAAGTMLARKMNAHLDSSEWKIIVVDRDETHYYQAGFIFIPFGMHKKSDVVKPKRQFIPHNIEFVLSDIERVEPDANRVILNKDNRVINYDYLVIATGTDIHPEQTAGMLDGGWRKNIFDFYTFEGTTALADYMAKWQGGRMVINITEMPIKCPVAPLEFIMLADWYFKKRGIRNKVELVYATPLPGAFTKPRAAAAFGDMLSKRGIQVESEYMIGEVDATKQIIRSYDEREISYDLLITIPTNMGADFIGRSGMGDELNFVPTNQYTLQSEKWQNVWVMGDATNIPASKAGSVVHFQLHTMVNNLLAHMKGKELPDKFDGHSLCYIESGNSKAAMIDFNYEVEPLPGTYPFPLFGPFSLLKETVINHWGKLAFRYMYYYLLLQGIDVPLPSKMTMAGKKLESMSRVSDRTPAGKI
jgi:sulfide:quinone oxidoreductase